MSTMPPPPVAQPQPQQQACPRCGQVGTLFPKSVELTVKKRSKFGVIWVLVCLVTVGFGLIAYLIWPRHKVVVGVDRFTECQNCKQRI